MHSFLTTNIEPANRCIVRVSTSFWGDSRGVYQKKSLTYLKRQCSGFNLLEEECGAVGAREAIQIIINLDSVEDGIYELVAVNEKRDWESGHIDDYDFELIKVKE